MTIATRERECIRLILESPGVNTAQLAHLLTITEDQARRTVETLRHRAIIEERASGGWQRRRSEVRAWRATA